MSRLPLSAVPGAPLTAREVQVMEAVCRGLTNDEIGALLFLAGSTVKGHLASAAVKLGARNRTHAAVIVVRDGLLGGAA